MTRPAPAPSRIALRTDRARLSSGDFVAVQIDDGPVRRTFVVATAAETRRGWIPADGRARYPGLHPAFDAAHRRALRALVGQAA
jgi:hypothetical protein